MPRLQPRLCPRPKILFVGINPSLRSAEVGHHFAGPGNPFWRLLHAAGLVPEPLTYTDDARLIEWKLALTNIVPRATREASELAPAEYARGRVALARLIRRLEPSVVAFVGSTVYRAFFGPRASGGAGPKPERLGQARVFVVPNPSGRNAAYPGFADKLVWFKSLRRFADLLGGGLRPASDARRSLEARSSLPPPRSGLRRQSRRSNDTNREGS